VAYNYTELASPAPLFFPSVDSVDLVAFRWDKDQDTWQLSALSVYHSAHPPTASRQRLELFATTTAFVPVPENPQHTRVTSLACLRLEGTPNDMLLHMCIADEIKRLQGTQRLLGSRPPLHPHNIASGDILEHATDKDKGAE
jgi:hypothetical protein